MKIANRKITRNGCVGLLIAILSILLFQYKTHFAFYLLGYLNWIYEWSTLVVIHLFILLLLVLLLVFSVVYVLLKQNKRDFMLNTLFSIIILGVLFVPSIDHPYAIDYLKGFNKRVSKQLPMNEIQEWLSELSVKDTKQNLRFERDEYPDFFSKLNPDTVVVGSLDTDSCSREVTLNWNSYLVSCGVTVGSDDIDSTYHDYTSKIDTISYLWLDEHK